MGTKSITEQEELKDNLDSSNELTTKVRRVEKTPFLIRWVKGLGWSIGVGNMRVTKWLESEEEALEKIGQFDWEFLISVMEASVRSILTMVEIENKVKEKGEDNEHN